MTVNKKQVLAEVRDKLETAGDVEDILLSAVEAACQGCGFPYGEAWSPYDGRSALYLRAAWHRPDATLEKFVTASKRFALARGVGTPGRVWASGQTEVIHDLRRAPEFSRQSLALSAGFSGLIGTPVRCDDEVAAILMFFMYQGQRPAPDLIEAVAGITGAALSTRLGESGLPGAPPLNSLAEHVAA